MATRHLVTDDGPQLDSEQPRVPRVLSGSFTGICLGHLARRITERRIEGSGLRFALAVALVEALHASTRVHQLLLSGEEGMAFVAQFDVQISAAGRASLEHVSARALDVGDGVCGVDVALHGVGFL